MIPATAIEIAEAEFAPFLRRASRRLGRRLDRAEFLYDADAIHRQLLLPLVVTAQTVTLEMDIARLDLDDRRRGGSPTAEVTWSGGLRLVYCPRPMAVELVAWLNAHGLSTPLRSPDVLDRGEYSWTRSVESAPSAD